MASVVITAIGDDRTGLVGALAAVVAEHEGNWNRSHMAELAGKFAGIVLVTVPDAEAPKLLESLESLEADGLLTITAELTQAQPEVVAPQRIMLQLVGQDHPGIVHDVSQALAASGVSIDELETEVGPAPQGGHMFTARAFLELPPGMSDDDLRTVLEDVAQDLMVDIDVGPKT